MCDLIGACAPILILGIVLAIVSRLNEWAKGL